MSSEPFLAAVVQLTSTSDEDANLEAAERWVALAAGRGARLIVTPENTNYLGPHDEKVRRAQSLDGEVAQRFSALARRHGVYLLLGSFNEVSDVGDRCHNTSLLFAPNGERVAVYRKIHLFDVDVSEAVRFRESDTVEPGAEPVVARIPLATLGLSICYDLRFPELYLRLVSAGAEIVTVPSAFTLTTGKEHWQPLIRARAIETQCYVLAAAQCGRHDDGGLRESYGHSMIVDPWGTVLAMAPEGPGIAMAEIDLSRVERVRRAIPVQRHRRLL